MIPRSRSAMVLSLLLAGGVHVAVAASLSPPRQAQLGETGPTAAGDTRIAASFSELVPDTTLRAEPAVTQLRPALPASLESPLPDTGPPPIKPDAPATATHQSSGNLVEHAGASSDPVLTSAPPLLAPVVAAVAPSMAASAVVPVQTAPLAASAPDAPAPLTARHAGQSVAASQHDTNAPTRTVRPIQRPDQFDYPPRLTNKATPPLPPKVKAKAKAKVAKPVKPTGSQTTAQSQRKTPAPARAGSGPRPQKGPSAAANYPGKVMRCISNAAKIRRSRTGTAQVTFQIDTRGRVTAVALTKSSGDPKLDRAATRALSRAGPCPPPPKGAQTRYSIRVK